MKTLRSLHVYLGCFFVPLILLYSLSGLWQLLDLHDLPLLGNISTWHTQRALKQGLSFTGPLVKLLGALFALSLITMTALGVRMAIAMTKKRRLVIALLVMGTIIPICAAILSAH